MEKEIERPEIKEDFTVRKRNVKALMELGLTETAANYLLHLIETFEDRLRRSKLSWEGRALAWQLIWHKLSLLNIGVTGELPSLASIEWEETNDFMEYIDHWMPLFKIIDDVMKESFFLHFEIFALGTGFAVVVADLHVSEAAIFEIKDRAEEQGLEIYVVRREAE